LNRRQSLLSDGVYIVEVEPFPDFKTAASAATEPNTLTPPGTQASQAATHTLSNGLKIILANP